MCERVWKKERVYVCVLDVEIESGEQRLMKKEKDKKKEETKWNFQIEIWSKKIHKPNKQFKNNNKDRHKKWIAINQKRRNNEILKFMSKVQLL